MFQALLIAMCALFGAPAFVFAQSTYVVGSVGADVFRSDRVEGAGLDGLTSSGEAVAFSLRIGTAITDRWGVELEFTRPSEIERTLERGFVVPLFTRDAFPAGIVALEPGLSILLPRMRLERRNTTLDAVAWIAQPVSDRVDLVYLGGVVFSRVTEDREFAFTTRPSPIVVVPYAMRAITYGVGPVVGVDGRVRLTAHLMLVPGLRLHGIDGSSGRGWLIRPSAGLGWRF